jgi:menaquinone-dependent protoporphyrinogen oxidase
MGVPVTAASKYGSTTEIAAKIADTLREEGFEAAVVPPEEVDALDGFEAVVLGSAVYAGHWLKPARELVERAGEALAARPVWLFSSGPIGDPPRPTEDPVDVAEVVRATGARDHRVFAGRLEKKRLSFGERAIVVAFRATEGDFRDWDDVAAWAQGIATSLRTGP